MSGTDDRTLATPEALARECPACGAKPGKPCRWGLAMTHRWGKNTHLHAHFSRTHP